MNFDGFYNVIESTDSMIGYSTANPVGKLTSQSSVIDPILVIVVAAAALAYPAARLMRRRK
jgi:hypothetical protein